MSEVSRTSWVKRRSGRREKHYIMAQSRLAGRALAHAIDAARK